MPVLFIPPTQHHSTEIRQPDRPLNRFDYFLALSPLIVMFIFSLIWWLKERKRKINHK